MNAQEWIAFGTVAMAAISFVGVVTGTVINLRSNTRVESRLEKMNDKMDSLDRRMSSLAERIATIEGWIRGKYPEEG